jgi:hypothetical protein
VLAFRVSVNGEHVCTAGIGPKGSLHVIVSWSGGSSRGADGRLHMMVGGLDTSADEHVRWGVPKLEVGDRITVEVIRTETVDPTSMRDPSREAQQRNVRQLGDEPATRLGRIQKRVVRMFRR